MKAETKSRAAVQEATEEAYAPLEVAEHLRQILASSPFRTSRQCKDLLRYLVEHSTGKDDGSLRERVIGMQVFGRDASYDTNGDPVVRIRAADVRKRLAQFYQSQGTSTTPLRLDLLPGSYRVRFRRTGPESNSEPFEDAAEIASAVSNGSSTVTRMPPTASAVSPPGAQTKSSARRWRLLWVWASLAALVLALIFARVLTPRRQASPQQRFWGPLVSTDQPVLVYLGSNMAYIFSPEFLSRYRTKHHLPNNGPEFPVDLSVTKSVESKDLLPVQDTFVTTADLSAAVALTSKLRDWKKPFVLRAANDLSIGDIRNRPTLLVGGFNNPWTLQTTESLPFALREGTTIEETNGQKRSWSVNPHTAASTQEDYALITRLLRSTTGGSSMAVAGIGQYGTQAAAELLTDPDRMRALLQGAPVGWETKNLEIVLRVKILQFQPVSTEVVAETAW